MTYRNSVAALNALRPRCPHCHRPPEPGYSLADHYETDHDRWLCDSPAERLQRPVLLTAWKGHGRNYGSWHTGGFQPRCGYVPPDGAPCTEIRVPLAEVIRSHLETLCHTCGKLLKEDLER